MNRHTVVRTFGKRASIACVLLLGGSAVTAGPAHAPPDSVAKGDHPLSVRLGGGLTIPFGDLANDDPYAGWQGNQGPGLTLTGGIRLPLVPEAIIRLEAVLHRFGSNDLRGWYIRSTEVARDTLRATATRQALAVGVQANLDYMPGDGSGWDAYWSGGIGLVYARYDDDIKVQDGERISAHDETTSLAVSAGMGLLVGRVDLLLSIGLREPRFNRVSATSWPSADLTISLDLPVH